MMAVPGLSRRRPWKAHLRTSRTSLALGLVPFLMSLWMLLPGCRVSGVHENGPIAGSYTLPAARPPGAWRPPSTLEERQRLTGLLQPQMPAVQDCMWRYAGSGLSGAGVSLSGPRVALIGVDKTGVIRWLELEPNPMGSFSLRECLSRELVKIRFEPPPSDDVILVISMPTLQVSRETLDSPVATLEFLAQDW